MERHLLSSLKLKQTNGRVAFGSPNRTTNVDDLIAKFMHHHHMSTEVADFVAEMANGVGPTITYKVCRSIKPQVVVELTSHLVHEYRVLLALPTSLRA